MRLGAALAIAAAFTGCPDKNAGAPSGDERLLAKLKAEKEREAKDGPLAPTSIEPLPKDEQVNPLAEFAAKGTQRRELKLPAKTQLEVGKASLKLSGLEASHTVGSGVAITTDDWFVKVAFDATGPSGTDIDLSAAWLERDGKQFPFARDAQAASRMKAHVALVNETATIIAYFEVPAANGLGPGLTLVVPDGSATAKLELQE